MATRQHRRNKRNRARSIAGQGKRTDGWLVVTVLPMPDFDEMQYRINRFLHAINNLTSIQTHTLGGSDEQTRP